MDFLPVISYFVLPWRFNLFCCLRFLGLSEDCYNSLICLRMPHCISSRSLISFSLENTISLGPPSPSPFFFFEDYSSFVNFAFSLLLSRQPEVLWAQRSDKIYLTVSLPDATDVSVKSEPEGLFSFSAVGAQGEPFSFSLKLYDTISPEASFFLYPLMWRHLVLFSGLWMFSFFFFPCWIMNLVFLSKFDDQISVFPCVVSDVKLCLSVNALDKRLVIAFVTWLISRFIYFLMTYARVINHGFMNS